MDQGSVTASELQELVDQKRQDAGIVVGSSQPDVFQRVAAKIRTMPQEAAEQLEARRQAMQLQERRRKAEECLYELGKTAGERYRGCRLETFEMKNAYQRRVVENLREYIEDVPGRMQDREGLVLFGPVGTGKDHLAYSLAIVAASQAFTIKWLNGQEWFGRIRDAMDTSETESSIIGEAARNDILVFSDPLPPVGDLSQHQATMLYRAIEARYSRGKITITTINVADDNEADRRMGAATWDRLCHGAWKIHCRWPSYRKPSREISP